VHSAKWKGPNTLDTWQRTLASISCKLP
jgi:hypothetical protein